MLRRFLDRRRPAATAVFRPAQTRHRLDTARAAALLCLGLLGLVPSAWLVGCELGEPFARDAIFEVVISPESATLTWVGDAEQFSAEAFKPTESVPSAIFVWSSSDTLVAAVDQTGLVTARGEGVSQLAAETGGVTDTVLVTVSIDPVPIRSNTWIAAGGGSWHAGANWSTGEVPIAADSVLIASDGSYTITLDADAVAGHLALGGATGAQILDTNGHRLQLWTGQVEEPARLVLDSSGSAAADLEHLTIANRLTVLGRLEGTSGAIAGVGQVETRGAGRLSFGASNDSIRIRAGVSNGGIVSVAAGAKVVLDGVVFDNEGVGVLELLGDASLTVAAGASVANAGTLRALAGALEANVVAGQGSFVSTGAVEIETGDLRVQGGQWRGVTNILAGASLILVGDHAIEPSATFPDEGEVVLDGAVALDPSPTLGASFENLVMAGGTLDADGPLLITARFIWSAGAIGGSDSLRVLGEAWIQGGDAKSLTSMPLKVEGILHFDGAGDLSLGNGAAIVIDEDGEWRQESTGGLVDAASSPPSFENFGVVTKSDAGTTTLDVAFTNHATLELTDGVLAFTGSFLHVGGAIVRGGGTSTGQSSDYTRLDFTAADYAILAGVVEPDHLGEPAWLGIAGDVRLVGSTLLRVELTGTPGLPAERVAVAGNVDLDGTLALDLSYTPTVGEQLWPVTWGTSTGAFASLTGDQGFEVSQEPDGLRLEWQ